MALIEIDVFPATSTSIYKGFSMAMLNNQMVIPQVVAKKHCRGFVGCLPHRAVVAICRPDAGRNELFAFGYGRVGGPRHGKSPLPCFNLGKTIQTTTVSPCPRECEIKEIALRFGDSNLRNLTL